MNQHLATATQVEQSSPEVQWRDRIITTQKQQLQGEYDQEDRTIQPDVTVRWVRSRSFPLRNEFWKSKAWLGLLRISIVSDRYDSSKSLIQIDNIPSLSSFSHARQDFPPCVL